MPNARIAAGFVAAATVCMLILFHAQYLSFWDYPLEGNLPLFGSSFAEPHEYARKIAETGDEYLLGVGKADITGCAQCTLIRIGNTLILRVVP